MLDQINSYLDGLEEKNDSLNGKLHELMESNRQARLEFRAQLFGAEAEEGEKEEEKHPADGEASSPDKGDQKEDSEAGKGGDEGK